MSAADQCGCVAHAHVLMFQISARARGTHAVRSQSGARYAVHCAGREANSPRTDLEVIECSTASSLARESRAVCVRLCLATKMDTATSSLRVVTVRSLLLPAGRGVDAPAGVAAAIVPLNVRLCWATK